MNEQPSNCDGIVTVEIVKVLRCKKCNRVIGTIRGDVLQTVCSDRHCGVANFFPVGSQQSSTCTSN